jgi:hypothetical protein
MIKVTPRMQHSQKLQSFIEKNRAEELSNIVTMLFQMQNTGHIDYEGSDGQLGQNGRNGALLKLGMLIDKCEFLERDEVCDALRRTLGKEWTSILAKLEKEHEVEYAASNKAVLEIAKATPVSSN